jgi:hypothetical protein
MDRLKNTTKNGVISWHTIGDAEEHYTERCTLGTLLERFKNTIKNGVIS